MQLSLEQCKALVGKTVLNIQNNAVNELIIQFTDETTLVLETVCVNSSIGLYGISATIA